MFFLSTLSNDINQRTLSSSLIKLIAAAPSGVTSYALAQGDFEVGLPDGSPAMPNTGSLVEINQDGTFTVVVDGLNQPTSVEFIGNTAYVVTLGGEIWKIENVSEPPFGSSQ